MTQAADNRIRQRALDPTQSFIVQAPAGSGKTELLVWRFLKLLTTTDQPEEIVALTFTRKAAAEMRHRILDAIENAAQAPQEDERAQTLAKLASAAANRDKEQGWNLTDNPSRLRIQTLDSFASMLVQRMPWSARFGAMPSIREDAKPLYREAAQTTMRHLESSDTRHADAMATLIRHVDGDTRRLTGLLVVMLHKRDQWLRHIGSSDTSDMWRQALEASWTTIVESELVGLKKHFPMELENDLIECAGFAAANLLEGKKTSPITNLISLTDVPDSTVEDLSQWQALASLLLTNDDTYRKQVDVRLGFPASKTVKPIKEKMSSLLRVLSTNEGFRQALANVRKLPISAYEQQQWNVLQALLIVLRLTVAELYLVFRREACVDFIETNQRANQALGSSDAPTDLALYFDTQIRHFLIDEFQDTSYTQFELLETLTGGWQPDDGRSLFLVGDPMQSIYRFREAEVGIFLAVQRYGLGSLRPELLQLETNFRSDARLVEWSNQIFPEVMPQQEDVATGAVPFAPAMAFWEYEQTQIQWHPCFDDDTGQIDYLADLIRQEHDEYPQQSLAVLVRNRSHVMGLVDKLQRQNIPFTTVDMQRLSQQAVVNDLFSLARALSHPADRLAWLAVLRAPWCGLTLADLTLLVGGDKKLTVWQYIEQSVSHKQLSDDGQSRLHRLHPVLACALENANQQSLAHRVESVWLHLGGPACVSANALNDAHTFLQLLAEHTNNQFPDVPNLQMALESRRASSIAKETNAVQIMTIHKAKGLEFDCVILPALERGLRQDDKALLEWAELPVDNRIELLLAPLEETGGDAEPKYEFLRRWNRHRRELETGRLLYVACTRARRRLHLLGNLKTDAAGEIKQPRRDTFLNLLWPLAESIFSEKVKTNPNKAVTGETTDRAFPFLTHLPCDWRLPNLPHDINTTPTTPSSVANIQNVEYRWAGDIVRQTGLVIHAILRRLPDKPLVVDDDSRQEWRGLLLESGIPANRLDEAITDVEQAINNTLADERGQWIFNLSHEAAHNEWALTGIADGTRIRTVIDRTFVDRDGVRWIIDYKTGGHEGGNIDVFLDREMSRYRPQLERYAGIMQNLDSRPIRLGLYFPLLRGWREWRFEPVIEDINIPK